MVNIYKQKLTLLQLNILRLLFIKTGFQLNQRQIANYLNVTSPAITKALPYLEKEKFIKISKDKYSKRLSIELNTDNLNVIQLKRIDNLSLIYETEFADFLEKNFIGRTIILFGSYSRGEDNFNSDIDIAIIGGDEKHLNLTKFEKIFEKQINVNFYSSFKEIHNDLKESILNGILLSGSVEL